MQAYKCKNAESRLKEIAGYHGFQRSTKWTKSGKRENGERETERERNGRREGRKGTCWLMNGVGYGGN